MANKKFGTKEVMDVTFYDTVTGKPVLFCDSLKMTNIENTAEETSARGGKGNAKLVSWDFNREATMQIQDALLSTRSFELLSGNKVVSGQAKIHMRQATEFEEKDGKMVSKGSLFPLIASPSGEIELAYKPNESASGILLYDIEDDAGVPLKVDSISEKTLTSSAAAGKKVVVYYTYNTDSAETYVITSDAFPSTYKIVGDTVIRNAKTQKDEAFQVVINRAKVKPGFSMQFQADGDPGAFDMDVEILRESDNTKMITMVQY